LIISLKFEIVTQSKVILYNEKIISLPGRASAQALCNSSRDRRTIETKLSLKLNSGMEYKGGCSFLSLKKITEQVHNEDAQRTNDYA
jgi:hypothetical protein